MLRDPVDLDSILADILDLDSQAIPDDLSAETCEAWDSARYLMIVTAVEQRFAVRFALADIERCTSRRLLIDFLDGASAPPG